MVMQSINPTTEAVLDTFEEFSEAQVDAAMGTVAADKAKFAKTVAKQHQVLTHDLERLWRHAKDVPIPAPEAKAS